jgi:Pyruvate/2-oxoacid:ferredoxin oxidoreductase delta subunit
MIRQIITIDEDKCTGCEECIPNCPEGAIRIVDGKARLVSDSLCDGLGACLGHCPEDAIRVEERESDAYDERQVLENILQQGPEMVKHHLRHLEEHNEKDNLAVALSVLEEKGIDQTAEKPQPLFSGCPGSRSMGFTEQSASDTKEEGKRASRLSHWPIQLHLISPMAPHYHQKDLILSADCVAYSLGDFHKDYLSDSTLAIACPKLDEGQEIYLAKIQALIEQAHINTLTVITMQVPCCGGLLRLAEEAAARASRKTPVKHIMVSLQGDILRDEWVA